MRLALLLFSGWSVFAQSAVSPIVRFRDEGSTVARSINNRGEVVGLSYSPASTQPRGFLRAADGTLQRLNAPNAAATILTAINDRGEVLIDLPNGLKLLRSPGGEVAPIATPLGSPLSITAMGINNDGYVVGSFQPSTGFSRRAYLRNLAGDLQVLGEIFGGNVEGSAISNAGRILLTRSQGARFHISGPSGDFPVYDFRLPDYPPERIALRGLNNNNLVVGEVDGRGILARADNPSDFVLFDLPDAVATSPYAINDRNEITGSVRDPAFRLSGFITSLCTPNVFEAARAHGSAAEIGTVPVEAEGFCLWSATTTAPWITLQRSLGSGTGAVLYRLAANPTGAERQGRILIGTREILVTQAASSCTYSVRTLSALPLPSSGGTVSIDITTGGGCPWTAYAPDVWIGLNRTAGTGSAILTALAGTAPPSGGTRQSQLSVAGTAVPISQVASPCDLTVSRTAIQASAEGGLEGIRVTTPVGCPWSLSPPVGWVRTVNGATSFQGPLDLTLRLDRNLGVTERVGSVLFSTTGRSVTVQLRQAGSATCGVTFSTDYRTVLGSGESFPLAANFGLNCGVTVTSDVPWIQIRDPLSYFSTVQVLPNVTRLPRRGVIRAGTASLTIDQFGNVNSQLGFVPITPCRLLDTRPSEAFPTGTPQVQGLTRLVTVAGRCGVPTTARAYALTVTARPKATLRFLFITRLATSSPASTSTLNSWDGRTVSNLAIVPANEFNPTVFLSPSDETDLTMDVIGYFADPVADSLVLYPVTPCRLLDTRTEGAPLGAATPRAVTAGGRCGIPSNAAALSLNVTTLPVSGAVDAVTVWPSGGAQSFSPLISEARSITAAATFTAAGPGSTINLMASHTSDLLVDVNGYFAPPSDAGLYFYPLQDACRVTDTRLRPYGAAIAPASTCPIPGSARAHALNVTAVPAGPLAFLSVFPAPNWIGNSTLNAYTGQVTANFAVVGDTGQGIGVTTSMPSDFVLDTLGYFAPVPAALRRPSLSDSFRLAPR